MIFTESIDSKVCFRNDKSKSKDHKVVGHILKIGTPQPSLWKSMRPMLQVYNILKPLTCLQQNIQDFARSCRDHSPK